MGKWMSLYGWLIFAGAALLVNVAAETVEVGGNMGWRVPTDRAAYSNWASSQHFKAGDILVFSWTGQHNVAEVMKGEFDNCRKNPINNITLAESPVNITLTPNTTSRYFICSVGGHCESGQKVAITLASSERSSSPTPTVGVASAIVLYVINIAVSFSYM